MSKRKVFIVQSWEESMYDRMFVKEGWQVVKTMQECDLVVFVGGPDVNPRLYKHNKHPTTNYRELQDTTDAQFFEMAKRLGKSMVGICRGGQFLNVCNGGTLIQHTDNHANGSSHIAVDCITGATIEVSSTHHQMMVPTEDAVIVAVANESSYKLICKDKEEDIQSKMPDDIEVLYYDNYDCLCFQPHPEFGGVPHCTKYFFSCIRNYLGLKA